MNVRNLSETTSRDVVVATAYQSEGFSIVFAHFGEN
jgi:hypothetical protein